MTDENRQETFPRPKAEDGAELRFRPDLGADVYVHPNNRTVYLDMGNGRFQRTERLAPEAPARAYAPADPAMDFPAERPRGGPKYGVDLSTEGYACANPSPGPSPTKGGENSARMKRALEFIESFTR